MIVSILDGEYIFGQDLSERGAHTFEITMEEYESIKNGNAKMKNKKVVKITENVSEIDPQQKLEDRIKQAEQLIIRKLALESIGEDTTEVEVKLESLSSNVD